MGRKSNQRTKNRLRKQSSTNIEDLILTHNYPDSYLESRYSPDSLRNLRKELKDAITKIYSKYIQNFCKIKEDRLSREDPFILIPAEELIIEKNYCNELTQKVKQLVHLDSLTDIYYTYCKSVVQFMSQISKEIQEIPSSTLQLSCVLEAYKVIQNSSRELSKVTSGIFENQPAYISCDNITKLAFLDRVIKQIPQPFADCTLSAEFRLIEKDLKDLATYVDSVKRPCKLQTRSFADSSVQEKSIDEIVNFIDGREEKKVVRRRRVSKASTAETSGSPFRQSPMEKLWTSMEEKEKSSSLDKEIKEFQAKLESARPLFQRLKPSLSEEWIKKIRSQILKNN